MNPHFLRYAKELLKSEAELYEPSDSVHDDDLKASSEIPVERDAALTSLKFHRGDEGGKLMKSNSNWLD